MSKKVRKSTSIVSGVLISTSLINNAVSLASVGPAVKTGVQMLGNGTVSLLNGTKDNILLPFVRGVISSIALPALLFFLVYGFYYNKCVLHSGKVANGINLFIAVPGAVCSFIRGFFSDKEKIDANNKKQEEVKVISVERLEDEIKAVTDDLEGKDCQDEAKKIIKKDKAEKIKKRIEALEKRLEATWGSLGYKLNWLKFQLGAPFRSETRKQYADLASYLKDMKNGLDSIEGIVEKWEKIKEVKENKLSLLLLEKSEGEENALIDLLGKIEQLEKSENTFLKQYSQNFFAGYIAELKGEVLKEFNIIVKKEKEEGGEAFISLIRRVYNFDKKTEGRFSQEVDNLCIFLKNSQKLLFVEKLVQGILKKCGLGCSRDLEKLLDFVFGKGLFDMNVLIGVFKGIFAADDSINKPKKELKYEDLLTILEKIDSEKNDLVALKEAITSAINELKKIGENDLSKSILEKAEKTEKMLGSLFEEKGGDGRNLMSVAGEYAEFCKEVKKIKEKTFNNEGNKELKVVLQLLSVFYEEKSKHLDDLLRKIPTEEKYNKDFVNCWKESVLKLKNDCANIGSKLKEFAEKVFDFSTSFVGNEEVMLKNIVGEISTNSEQDMSYIFNALEVDFNNVYSLNFAERDKVKRLWESWKSDFIKEYESEVNEKVAALRTEAEEKEKQAEKDEKIIEDVRQAINSFKLEEDYKSKIDLLEKQLSEVSTQNKEGANALNSKLHFLFDFCECTLKEKTPLSEKLKRLTVSIQQLQNFPAFFESLVTYLSDQFDASAKKGYDKDFYKLLLSLKDFEKVPEGNSEDNGVRLLLNKFYAKVKDVVVEKAKKIINEEKELKENFGDEIAFCCNSLAKLEESSKNLDKRWVLKNLALFFFEFSYVKKYIESDPVLSQISSLKKRIDPLGKKFEEKFSKIKLVEFLSEFINFKVDKSEESKYLDAFELCLKSPEMLFSEGVNVGNFFALGNDEKNFELLLRVRVNLQYLQQSWYRSDFNNAEINLKTVLELLSKFKGNEKVIQSIKSAVVSYMSNFFNIFINEFLKEQELKIFNGFSDETFAELFKLFDTPEALNGKNSKEIKRSWFLYLFGFYYKTRGSLSSKATKYVEMVTKSKLIKEKKDRNFILDFFNTLNGGTEQFPVLSDENIRLGLETFFGDDRDFAEIAYGIFASYKKEFRWRDVASDAVKKVSDFAEKGFNMFGDVTKNLLGNLWG